MSPKSKEGSHSSATEHSKDIEHYLKTEINFKAIHGPFKHPPFGNHTHHSPFMTRDKPDSDNRRVIIDLSWPEQASINHFTPPNIYLETVYKLQYPTTDTITSHLAGLPKGMLIYKVDLARAFRQLRIDPGDYNLLCLKWGGLLFRHLLPFWSS